MSPSPSPSPPPRTGRPSGRTVPAATTGTTMEARPAGQAAGSQPMPSVHLQPEDREKIQKLVDRPPRLNARMKAVVLLDAARAPGRADRRASGRPRSGGRPYRRRLPRRRVRGCGPDAGGALRRRGRGAGRVTPGSSRRRASVAARRGSTAHASRSGSSSRSANWVPRRPSY